MIDWAQRKSADALALQEATAAREMDKREKQARVDKIVVLVGGNPFQGDEVSQGRMLRRADTLEGEETVSWVMADNAVAQVTSSMLREAARLAVDEMGRIWIGDI